MTGFETFLSAVLMIFILGIFVSFVVLMGVYRAQEEAERRALARRDLKRRTGDAPESPVV